MAKLSDEDVERIAQRVAELLKSQPVTITPNIFMPSPFPSPNYTPSYFGMHVTSNQHPTVFKGAHSTDIL